jgi:predicted methyltransferase
MKHGLVLFVFMLASACSTQRQVPQANVSPPSAPPVLPASLEEAVASPLRMAPTRERDQYRHPLETLSFFGVQPGMTVVEIWPSTGWYTQILAPYLASHGHYIAAKPAANGNPEGGKMYDQWINANPEIAKVITNAEFNPPQKLELAPEGSADMVVTFRNVHNWMAKGAEAAAFNAFYKALKPGGVLGLVEHRADAKSKFDPKAASGYVREKDVIRFATAAGFKLDKKSEINANPKDKKNYPSGVWSLPPTLKLGEKDREKYLAIGESDRMTLRFIKPTEASAKKR